ncbi:hypothetical protein TWF788_009316 [Orbilia oligospora]|uniref:Uncharacterized protein n=1 Tax=Orbilia oligospora TaxID=2813651 RepID=A0A7C8KHS6_ORBOL|nr:hypothetical protein TWF788_009316 [Orbilia oligospora]
MAKTAPTTAPAKVVKTKAVTSGVTKVTKATKATTTTKAKTTKTTKTTGAAPRRGAPTATVEKVWGVEKRRRDEMVKRFGEEYTSLVEAANARNGRAAEGHRAEAEKGKREKRKASDMEAPSAAASGPKPKRVRTGRANSGRSLEPKPIEVLLQRASPNLPAQMRPRPWYTGTYVMWTPGTEDFYWRGWWYPDGVDGFVRYQPR